MRLGQRHRVFAGSPTIVSPLDAALAYVTGILDEIREMGPIHEVPMPVARYVVLRTVMTPLSEELASMLS